MPCSEMRLQSIVMLMMGRSSVHHQYQVEKGYSCPSATALWLAAGDGCRRDFACLTAQAHSASKRQSWRARIGVLLTRAAKMSLT